MIFHTFRDSRVKYFHLKNSVIQNDHECYCGGFGVQHYRNSGKCGICGDAFDAKPRKHEAPDGDFATGIITKVYNQAITSK